MSRSLILGWSLRGRVLHQVMHPGPHLLYSFDARGFLEQKDLVVTMMVVVVGLSHDVRTRSVVCGRSGARTTSQYGLEYVEAARLCFVYLTSSST